MANEVRLIDAYTLAEDVEGLDITVAGNSARWTDAKHTVLRIIAEQSEIDPERLRPKGRWERTGEADYKCSVCGFRFTSGDPIEMFPYCRCGCKMEE